MSYEGWLAADSDVFLIPLVIGLELFLPLKVASKREKM
jgi:hypothetical protein